MERCSWDLRNLADGSPFLTLVCDFRHANFPTTRKMQIVYEAAAELAEVFVAAELPCLIGVGPLDNNFREEQWQLVLIPDNDAKLSELELEKRRKSLVLELHAFSVHLNETPRHFLLDPNQILLDTPILN